MPPKKILVVEDSPTMRQLLCFALKRLDVRIVEAIDGVDGLKKVTAEKFDLIITDINMPIMDGLKLVSLIRSNSNYKDIPIIIVTTEGSEEDKKRGLALGANAYIPKPIQSGQVVSLVKSMLNI